MSTISDVSWVNVTQRLAPRIRLDKVEVRFFIWGYVEYHLDNPVHRHSYYEVCLVARRTGRFCYNGTWHEVGPGDVFIARPGISHQIVSDGEGMELYWVAYDWGTVGGDQDELGRLFQSVATSDTVTNRDDGRLTQVWQTLQKIACLKDAGTEYQVKCLASSVVLGVCQLFCPDVITIMPPDTEDRESILIRQAVTYIHDNLENHLTLSGVSRHVNLSERHFGRLFTRYMGCSFVQYVHGLRLETARLLLHDSNQSIIQVAERVGLGDVHYFSRLFTRTFGMPPSQYRLHHKTYRYGHRRSGMYL